MPYTLDPRYDPSTIKTKIRVPQQVGRPNLSPATTAQNIANERQFRGVGRDGLHSAASGDVNSPAAKEIGRRAGVRLGVLPELSTADSAMVNNQALAASDEIASNNAGLNDLAKKNSAAVADVKYPNSATPGYAPDASRPDLTQKFTPMTKQRIGLMDDTAAWNVASGKPSGMVNNSEAFIVAPDGRVAAPGGQIPVVRHPNSVMSPEAIAHEAAVAGRQPFEPKITVRGRIGDAVVSAKNAVADSAYAGRAIPALQSVKNIPVSSLATPRGAAGTAVGLYDTASNQVALNDNSTKIDRAAQAGEDLSRASGATAGGLAGAALGTAVRPGIGTVAGSLIGGTIGYMAPGAVISGGRRLVNRIENGSWEDPGSPLEQQKKAGTADLSILDRSIKGVNDFIENEKRDVPQSKSDSTGSDSVITGGTGSGSGYGGEGWMTDSKGNKATWNPATQQFEGTLASGKKLSSGPVNSAGQMFATSEKSAPAQQYDRIGMPVTRGRGAILLGDSANDPYKKILNDPNVPDMVKAKLKLRMDVIDQGNRRATVDEKQQQLAQTLGIGKFNMDTEGNSLDNEGKQLALKNSQRIQSIRDQLDVETDPDARQRLMDQYDLLTGQSGKFQVAQADTGVPDGYGGTVKQSVVVNNRTGAIQPVQIPGIGSVQKAMIDPKSGRRVVIDPQSGKAVYAN